MLMSSLFLNQILIRKDTMTTDIKVNTEPQGSWLAGYITLTDTIDGVVSYGLFENLEQATVWAKQLSNATIQAVCVPAHNRG